MCEGGTREEEEAMKKPLMFMNKPLSVRRIIVYIFGLYLMTFGIAIAVNSDFGVSPVTTLPYVCGKLFNVSVGTGTMIAYVLYILIQVPVYRKEFKIVYILQFPAALLFGWFTDINKAILNPLGTPEGFLMKFAWCIVSIIILSIGLTMYLDADIMAIPPDAMAVSFAWLTGKKTGSCKRVCDIVIMLTSLALSLIFLHSYQGFWVGTIMHAVFNGTMLNFWRKLWRKPLLKFLYGEEIAAKIMAPQAAPAAKPAAATEA